MSNGGHVYSPDDLHFQAQPETEINTVQLSDAGDSEVISANGKEKEQ